MKFAHIADVHIGTWREAKLLESGVDAFVRAIDECIERDVDFVLIAGDLFNTALPAVDRLKRVVLSLRKLKEHNIPMYFIPGSHDYSPSGKTMLDVLEAAELGRNVVRGSIEEGKLKLQFTVDEKTGTKITGILGKRGMLDRKFYESLELSNLESEEGFKIFMYHTALTEFKPKGFEQMDSMPISYFPKQFDYYAGGHVHVLLDETVENYGQITMPGPLFPCNFKELERLKHGGFYIYETDKPLEHVPIKLFEVESLKIDCSSKTPEQITQEIHDHFEGKNLENTIVTLRFKGTMHARKVTELDMHALNEKLYQQSAHLVLKSTSALSTTGFEEIKVNVSSVNNLEDEVIGEHVGQIPLNELTADKEKELIMSMLKAFDMEKGEGERVIDFEERIISNGDSVSSETFL